jgi:hypothetical protein
MTVVAIHQSQYVPWFPYFKKIALSDIFVVMDTVQFQKNGLQNRNKIRNYDGDFWLTIPVTGHKDDLILEKKISGDHWKQKHWKSISASYSKAPHWPLYKDRLEQLYKKDYSTLHEVNRSFLEFLLESLSLDTKIVYLSQLNALGTKSELVLSVCTELKASTYLSGYGGKAYLQEHDFRDAHIEIEYRESTTPRYPQFHGDFIDSLSILDMMLNVTVPEIRSFLQRQDNDSK